MTVTEEMIEAGRKAFERMWLINADYATKNAYLAMRSKDHSIAVDDVREASQLEARRNDLETILKLCEEGELKHVYRFTAQRRASLDR